MNVSWRGKKIEGELWAIKSEGGGSRNLMLLSHHEVICTE